MARTEWRISGRWQVKDQTEHICAGARRVCEHCEKRPHSVLSIRDGAQRLLLGALFARGFFELLLFVEVFRSYLETDKRRCRKPSGAIYPRSWEGKHAIGSLARQRCSRARHAERNP